MADSLSPRAVLSRQPSLTHSLSCNLPRRLRPKRGPGIFLLRHSCHYALARSDAAHFARSSLHPAAHSKQVTIATLRIPRPRARRRGEQWCALNRVKRVGARYIEWRKMDQQPARSKDVSFDARSLVGSRATDERRRNACCLRGTCDSCCLHVPRNTGP